MKKKTQYKLSISFAEYNKNSYVEIIRDVIEPPKIWKKLVEWYFKWYAYDNRDWKSPYSFSLPVRPVYLYESPKATFLIKGAQVSSIIIEEFEDAPTDGK